MGLECPAPPLSVSNLAGTSNLIPQFLSEKWARMTSTWEADLVQELILCEQPRAGLARTRGSQKPQSTLLPLMHVTGRAQAEGKFLASGSTYWLGNRRRGLRSRY